MHILSCGVCIILQAAQEEAASLRKAKKELSQAQKAHADTHQELQDAQSQLAEAREGNATELSKLKEAEEQASSAAKQAKQELEQVIIPLVETPS